MERVNIRAIVSQLCSYDFVLFECICNFAFVSELNNNRIYYIYYIYTHIYLCKNASVSSSEL